MSATPTAKERPILFSGPMVRAILAGRKTQTRRIIPDDWWRCLDPDDPEDRARAADIRYGAPGDRLWVRETWLELDPDRYTEPSRPRDALSDQHGPPRRNGCAYRAECDAESDAIRAEYGYRWKPSIHMPRWASRLTLEVTEVRVQRLQEISEDDAKAEGGKPGESGSDWTDGKQSYGGAYAKHYRHMFPALWDSINGKRGSWDSNPWVWAITFKRLEPEP